MENLEPQDFKGLDRRSVGIPSPGRDWTEGSIIRNLLLLSWPLMISQGLNMIGPTIDMIWVGKLGTAPIAGVGVAGMVVMFMMAAMMGLAVGTRAMIARFVGAGDTEGANNAAKQAFVVGVCFAVTVGTIGIYFSEQILVLLRMEADVIAEGAPYMRIMFVGGAAMTFRMLAEGIMQSSGDTITPMRISILFRAFHTVLCPFLVFGLWIFPQLGVRGAALTNVLSQSLGLGLGIWVLLSARTRLRLTMSGFQLDLHMIGRIVKIGIPAAIVGMQMGLIHIVMMSFMVPFGTVAVASHILGQRLEMLMVTLMMGLGMGAGVLTGQNLGAGQPERAERTGWLALGIAEGIMVLGSVALLLGAEYIVKVFNTDPPLVAMASSFIRIAAVGYLVIASIAILKHVLAGAGDTVPAMIFEVGHLWIVMLPLAFLLPRFHNLGVYGIRWAIVTGVYAGAAAYLIYFQMGKWKKKRV